MCFFYVKAFDHSWWVKTNDAFSTDTVKDSATPTDVSLTLINDPYCFSIEQKEADIPWRVSRDHDAVFSVNAHNIKISARGGNEVSKYHVNLQS